MSQAVEPSPQCPVQQLTRNGLRKDDPLDPLLLDWVAATASYGFLMAYDRFVHPLSDAD